MNLINDKDWRQVGARVTGSDFLYCFMGRTKVRSLE